MIKLYDFTYKVENGLKHITKVVGRDLLQAIMNFQKCRSEETCLRYEILKIELKG